MVKTETNQQQNRDIHFPKKGSLKSLTITGVKKVPKCREDAEYLQVNFCQMALHVSSSALSHSVRTILAGVRNGLQCDVNYTVIRMITKIALHTTPYFQHRKDWKAGETNVVSEITAFNSKLLKQLKGEEKSPKHHYHS
jgi:hypothetical protein